MAQNVKKQEAVRFGESLFNTWVNSLDRVSNAQKELEDLFLQSLEIQKDNLEKMTDDVNLIQEEQKKLFNELRENAKLNLQKNFGPSAGQVYEQWNSQLDEVSNRALQLIETPYKESLKLLNQSQDRFQETIKNGISQQQKVRDEIAEQIKASQKVLFEIFETNSKAAFALFK
ncbi:hypothetical protein [Bacillus xiapuensis]|uniref:PhaP protein n=1 Tax=Bacillus xiapuensis TaxID=2014075 RepID=A0ABU6N5U0_9BACI|nr:hypothetical protein [Bacillus xiapuensis]